MRIEVHRDRRPSQDETRTRIAAGYAWDTDVEPHRRVERRPLRDDQVLQLGVERIGLALVDEVAALHAPGRDGVDDPVGDLAQRPLALRGARGATEVLLGEDVRGVQAPRRRDFDADLLEGDLTGLPIGDTTVTTVPGDLVVGVHAFGGEVPPDADAGALRSDCHEEELPFAVKPPHSKRPGHLSVRFQSMLWICAVNLVGDRRWRSVLATGVVIGRGW